MVRGKKRSRKILAGKARKDKPARESAACKAAPGPGCLQGGGRGEGGGCHLSLSVVSLVSSKDQCPRAAPGSSKFHFLFSSHHFPPWLMEVTSAFGGSFFPASRADARCRPPALRELAVGSWEQHIPSLSLSSLLCTRGGLD